MLSAGALAQETIFNVPSGDILDKGKIYGEFDSAYLWDDRIGTYTPRVVVGIGHQLEIGLNLNGITTLGPLRSRRRRRSSGRPTAGLVGHFCSAMIYSSLFRTRPTTPATTSTFS